jgi:heme oxygenase
LTTSPISQQLKIYTRSNHQQLEKILVAQMRSIHTKEQYTDLLNLFFTYFGALEKRINKYIGTGQLADYPERRKTESLLEDINSLGGSTIDTIEADDVPQIDNELQAFGALYVIEGSTLGGVMISKMMKKQLDLQDGRGLSFFDSYGSETEAMWSQFKEVLDQQVSNESDERLLLAAADETFLKFKLWIDKQSKQN